MFDSASLYCPFPPAINQFTLRVERETGHWAAALGLASDDVRDELRAHRFSHLVGRFYPDVTYEPLRLISDWTAWLFWLDDFAEERDEATLRGTFERLLAVLGGESGGEPAPEGVGFEVALADMRRRLSQLGPDRFWRARFAESVSAYLSACVWEAVNRGVRRTPRVQEYVAARRCSGGMCMYVDLVELAGGAALPIHVRRHRDVARLVQIASNVACWHNDLFSLAKELERGDVHNLVIALCREKGCSLEEGVAEAIRMTEREVRGFESIGRDLPTFEDAACDAQLARYVRGLQSLMRGNLDWSIESARYAGRAGLGSQNRSVSSARAPSNGGK
jgi:5-epi-alpha-selinene synthase